MTPREINIFQVARTSRPATLTVDAANASDKQGKRYDEFTIFKKKTIGTELTFCFSPRYNRCKDENGRV